MAEPWHLKKKTHQKSSFKNFTAKKLAESVKNSNYTCLMTLWTANLTNPIFRNLNSILGRNTGKRKSSYKLLLSNDFIFKLLSEFLIYFTVQCTTTIPNQLTNRKTDWTLKFLETITCILRLYHISCSPGSEESVLSAKFSQGKFKIKDPIKCSGKNNCSWSVFNYLNTYATCQMYVRW